MSDTPTPETDAVWDKYIRPPYAYGAGDLRILAQKLERERDEARQALMKIEDLFIDGTDIYADRENMGTIARAALEGAK